MILLKDQKIKKKVQFIQKYHHIKKRMEAKHFILMQIQMGTGNYNI